MPIQKKKWIIRHREKDIKAIVTQESRFHSHLAVRSRLEQSFHELKQVLDLRLAHSGKDCLFVERVPAEVPD